MLGLPAPFYGVLARANGWRLWATGCGIREGACAQAPVLYNLIIPIQIKEDNISWSLIILAAGVAALLARLGALTEGRKAMIPAGGDLSDRAHPPESTRREVPYLKNSVNTPFNELSQRTSWRHGNPSPPWQ